MKITKKIFFSFILILTLGLGFFKFMPSEEKIQNTIISLRVGSGDDITGLLLKQVIKASENIDIDGIDVTEGKVFDFTFKDC